MFSLNRMRAEQLIEDLQASRESLTHHLPDVIESAKELSGYREPQVIHEPVFTGRIQREGYMVEKYFVKGEGDYPIPYLLVVPDNPNGKAVLYLHPEGKSAEAAEGGEIETLTQNGFTVLAPDLVGIGEMGPGDLRGDSYIEGTSYNLWFASVLIGRSIVGIRAGDVVRLTRLLRENPGVNEIYGIGRQEMTPVLLHAAAFEPAITRVALAEPYPSYRSIVMNRFYDSGFIHSTVAGALTAYDLPDLAASLAPRKLLMAGVTDGAGNAVSPENISEDLDVIRKAYQQNEGAKELEIVSTEQADEISELVMGWLE